MTAAVWLNQNLFSAVGPPGFPHPIGECLVRHSKITWPISELGQFPLLPHHNIVVRSTSVSGPSGCGAGVRNTRHSRTSDRARCVRWPWRAKGPLQTEFYLRCQPRKNAC
jgi:hypothetical protein